MVIDFTKCKIISARILMVILVIGLAGCEKSSSSSGNGAETLKQTVVKGNISSSSFCGGLDGISVGIAGNTTSTDTRGRFQLDRVPTGSQSIVFSKCNERAKMQLAITSGQILTLSNVRVGRNSASGGQKTNSPTPKPSRPTPAVPDKNHEDDDHDDNDNDDDSDDSDDDDDDDDHDDDD